MLDFTTTTVFLSWHPPTGFSSSYVIEILEDSTLNTIVTSTSATIEGLTPGNYYTFLVSAVVDGSIRGDDNSVFTYTSKI